MQAFYCDHFVLPLPEGHRFPMQKYRLLRERLSHDPTIELQVPAPTTRQEVERVHDRAYVDRVFRGTLTREEVRRLGFPWSPQLVERSLRSVGGTLAASRAARRDGVSVNLAGGTHHAFAGSCGGFCVFNDVAVAVRAHQAEASASRFAVIDLDVHQGNGTAAIFAGDPSVFTLSVHGENNFPFLKETSDLDIGLPDGTGDDAYLGAVERGVRMVVTKAPELAFYVAGADPFEHDRLGRLAVTKAGLAERDRIVFERCEAAGVGVVVVMSGGYAARVADTVDIHESTVRQAVARFSARALT